jgi:putative flippase GtrA
MKTKAKNKFQKIDVSDVRKQDTYKNDARELLGASIFFNRISNRLARYKWFSFFFGNAMSPRTRYEIVGYGVVGVVGAALDFIVFYTALYLGLLPLIAQWAGAMTGFLHNHLWQHYKIFTHERRLTYTTTLSATAAFAGVVISGPVLTGLQHVIPNYAINKVIIIGFLMITLFLIRKYLIFTNR